MSSTIFPGYFLNNFQLSQLLLATGQLLVSAHIEVHPAVLRIFQFIKSIFSSNPVSKNICVPSPFHVICEFNKHTVYSIIHSINKSGGKIRCIFKMNLCIILLDTSSIWTENLYNYCLNIGLQSFGLGFRLFFFLILFCTHASLSPSRWFSFFFSFCFACL